MYNSQFTPEDRVIKAKVGLHKERPFFSYILLAMNIEEGKRDDPNMRMAINGYGDLFWHPDFVTKCSDEELAGTLCHEAMHMATLTHVRLGKRDTMLWNIATDIVINYMLFDEGFVLPEDVLRPKNGIFEFDGENGKVKIDVSDKSAEEVYDWLLNHIKEVKISLAPCDADGNPIEDDNPNGNYKGQLDSHLPGDQDSEGNSTNQSKGIASDRSNEQKWKKKALEAATAAKTRGTLPGSIERMLDGILEPEIDWRQKLYAYMTNELPVDYTMRRPGRRFYSTGVYYPSVVRENLEIIVGCDNSGSITYGDAKSDGGRFISEAVGICEAFNQISLRIIWWDTSVDKRNDLVVTKQNKDDIISHKPYGGGGTTMSCFNAYIKKKNYKSRVYVILTDGLIEGKPIVPNDGVVLFVLSPGGSDSIIKKYGEVCKLSCEDTDSY